MHWLVNRDEFNTIWYGENESFACEDDRWMPEFGCCCPKHGAAARAKALRELPREFWWAAFRRIEFHDDHGAEFEHGDFIFGAHEILDAFEANRKPKEAR